MKQLIAICNPSGGVGKTTFAINLADLLERKDNRVLVGDLDPQESTSKFYLKETYVEMDRGHDPVFKTHNERIDIIPARCFYQKDVVTNIPFFDMENANTILKDHMDEYDVIIFDIPSSISKAMYWALSVVSKILIPAYGHSSVENIHNMKINIEHTKKKSNPDLVIGGVVLTKFNPNTRLDRSLKEELDTELGTDLIDITIPIDSNVQRAYIAGMSILEYSPNSKAAVAYSELVDELLDKWNKIENTSGSMVRIGSYIPAEDFDIVESIKEELGISRSEVIREVLAKGLEQFNKEKEMTAGNT